MRYAVHRFAAQLPVTGFVENLDDGRVRMVVEGSAEVIGTLLTTIQTEGPGILRSLDRYESSATGEFSDFRIQR